MGSDFIELSTTFVAFTDIVLAWLLYTGNQPVVWLVA